MSEAESKRTIEQALRAFAAQPRKAAATGLFNAPGYADKILKTINFQIADPQYVQAAPLLVKGSLTVQSQCGVTAGTDSGTADQTAVVTKATVDAIQSSVNAAQKNSSSGDRTNATPLE